MSERVAVEISQAFKAGENYGNVPQDGNVLDRLCEVRQNVGAKSCEGCVFFERPETYAGSDAELRNVCAHQNLSAVLEDKGIDPAKTLMFGATAHNVGVYEQLVAEDQITTHRFGWQMVAGYNAMYAVAGDVEAIGMRAADCSIVKGERELPDGRMVMLQVHMTRDNIEGESAQTFGPNKDQSFLQHTLQVGAKQYGMSYGEFVAGMKLEQMAKIDQLDYTFKPDTLKDGTELTAEQNMDRLFKGWFDAGKLHNTSNPDWKRGDPINPDDLWVADYQDMTEQVILASGVPAENIRFDTAINPGDVQSGHASNAAANDPKRPKDRRRPDARDAYLVVAR